MTWFRVRYAQSTPLKQMDHPNSSPNSPRYYDGEAEDVSTWHLTDHHRQRRKDRRPNTQSLILYLSIVAILVILLMNHRSIHQYVDPSIRQLSSRHSRSAVRSASNAHKKIQHAHSLNKNKGQYSRDSRHNNHNQHNHHTYHRVSTEDTHSLRQEFENWVKHHKRNYGTKEETEKRWNIWKDNHFQTIQKNLLHGPCKHTQKHVFGSNHFKDLSPEEFKKQYLTGYGGPIPVDSTHNMTAHLHPLASSHVRHESVQNRYMEHIRNNSGYPPESRSLYTVNPPQYFSANTTTPCSWYQVGCWLQTIVGKYSSTVTSIGKHREPTFNASSYPTAIDWRQVGAVTDIHTQGNCGACWAISAVETVESAYYISTGTLLDLSTTEIIACDSSCQMCRGGWPQNAYDYIKEHKGTPLEKNLKYNGNFLLAMTECKYGSSSAMSESVMASYQQSVCPASNQNAGGRSNSNSASSSSTNNARYGTLKGYAYATDRCTCYSTGSGCDCSSQSEDMAIRNVASYGPATVCLDASTWQDYTGGIITASSGCSAKFLDMNHCVQVVGYAFSSNNYNNNNNNGGKNQQQQQQNQKQQGNQQVTREGYWIVRNQWSSYWGMNGYAYVAMGANTCGILNDMTQVFI